MVKGWAGGWAAGWVAGWAAGWAGGAEVAQEADAADVAAVDDGDPLRRGACHPDTSGDHTAMWPRPFQDRGPYRRCRVDSPRGKTPLRNAIPLDNDRISAHLGHDSAFEPQASAKAAHSRMKQAV